MAPGKPNRHYLLCPVCVKTQESLSCHLRRSCMKDKPESDREEVLEKAKNDVLDLLKTGRAFSYSVLSRIISSSNPLEKIIRELKHHHLFVTGEPTPLPNGNPMLVAETGCLPGPASRSSLSSTSSKAVKFSFSSSLDESSDSDTSSSESGKEETPDVENASSGEPTSLPNGNPMLVAETGCLPGPASRSSLSSTSSKAVKFSGSSSSDKLSDSDTSSSTSGEGESSDVESTSSGELFQCNRETTDKARTSLKKANEMGILKKHSLDHPLLHDFAEHLRVVMQNTKYKQEVESVSRYLYYADPSEPSLKFVRDREKLLNYTRKQFKANYRAQTSVNYLKCLERFLDYNLCWTNLRKDDKALYNECSDFVDYIGSVQNILSKKVSKEIVSKRQAMFMDKDDLRPRDCLAIFEKAEKEFLNIMDQLTDSSTLPLAASHCIFVLYYLEAIVILKHLQMPCVVANMKVAEWLGRRRETEHAIIFVKDHKTASQFVVGIALSKQEEEWFEKYYTRVRPQHLAAKGKRKRDDKDGDDFFFVSSTGKKINNPTNDLDRLHEKHNLPHVNSQTVRRIFETEAKLSLLDTTVNTPIY